MTRVLNAVCDAEHTMDMTVEKCWGFQVFHRIEFYAIRSEELRMFFDRKASQATPEMTKNSALVLVRNKHSYNRTVGNEEEMCA